MARPIEGIGGRPVSWLAAAALWIVIGTRITGDETQQQAQTAGLLELIPPELRFEERPLPASENAFPLLLEAVSAFVDLPDDKENKELRAAFFDSYDADAPLPEGPLLEHLTAWMARNDPALALVTKAGDRGRLAIPSPDPILEKVNDLRKLAHIFLLRCRLAAAKGDFTAAVAELRTPLRFWRLVRGGGGSLISYMIGTGLEALTLSEARRLAHEPGASAETLEELLGMIQPAATGPHLVRMFQRELHIWIEDLGKLPAHATVEEAVRELTEGFPAGGYRDGLKAGIARILEGHPRPLEADELEANFEATRAILALRLHIERFREPAESLEALVERKVLPTTPRDPFCGKPLGYSLENGKLWSVGPDGDMENNVWPAPKT